MGNVSLINGHIDEPKGMTDNEIIKGLEHCLNGCGKRCEFLNMVTHHKSCHEVKTQYSLDLINRQKAEIERFKNRQKPTAASGYKIENGKVVFFTNMLGGCKIVKENLDEVVKTLNELLQECYSKDEIAFALKCTTEELKTAKAEAVKEFAERFTEKANKTTIIYVADTTIQEQETGWYQISIEDFNNILKEMVGEDK